MSKDRDSVLTQAIKKRFADPSKGKEIELKPYESFDYICGNILGVADYLAMSKDESTEKSARIIRTAVTKLIKIRIPTRQSPQINIDELTGVIEREITRFVPNAKDKFADVLAQAIASHLNGKGDGDE